MNWMDAEIMGFRKLIDDCNGKIDILKFRNSHSKSVSNDMEIERLSRLKIKIHDRIMGLMTGAK